MANRQPAAEHPLVADYLDGVAARLGGLPPARRDEELRELRLHLEALIAGHRAQGHDEDAAVAAALRQFGHAAHLGRELRAAGRAARPPRVWPLIATYLGLVALIFGAFATANDKPTDFPHHVGDQLALAFLLPAGMLILRAIDYLRGRIAAR